MTKAETPFDTKFVNNFNEALQRILSDDSFVTHSQNTGGTLTPYGALVEAKNTSLLAGGLSRFFDCIEVEVDVAAVRQAYNVGQLEVFMQQTVKQVAPCFTNDDGTRLSANVFAKMKAVIGDDLLGINEEAFHQQAIAVLKKAVIVSYGSLVYSQGSEAEQLLWMQPFEAMAQDAQFFERDKAYFSVDLAFVQAKVQVMFEVFDKCGVKNLDKLTEIEERLEMPGTILYQQNAQLDALLAQHQEKLTAHISDLRGKVEAFKQAHQLDKSALARNKGAIALGALAVVGVIVGAALLGPLAWGALAVGMACVAKILSNICTMPKKRRDYQMLEAAATNVERAYDDAVAKMPEPAAAEVQSVPGAAAEAQPPSPAATTDLGTGSEAGSVSGNESSAQDTASRLSIFSRARSASLTDSDGEYATPPSSPSTEPDSDDEYGTPPSSPGR